MKDNRGYVCIIPERVLLDTSMTVLDLRIYGLVSSFMYTTGLFTQSNKTMAEKLDVDPRSIRRSITRQVEKGYLQRSEGNNRHISIRQTPLPESAIGGGTLLSGGEDTNVPQSVLPINTKAAASKQKVTTLPCAASKTQVTEPLPPANVKQVLNQALELGLNESMIVKMIKPKTLQDLSLALTLYATRGESQENPYRWLRACMKDKYWEDEAALQAQGEAISHIPAPKYTCMEKLHSDALAALYEEGIVEPVWNDLDSSASFEAQAAFNLKLESKKQSLNIYV